MIFSRRDTTLVIDTGMISAYIVYLYLHVVFNNDNIITINIQNVKNITLMCFTGFISFHGLRVHIVTFFGDIYDYNAFYICSYYDHHVSYYLHSSVRKQCSPRAVFPLPFCLDSLHLFTKTFVPKLELKV